jgi:FKBP-type peptidyl-prolyl cis-trans isomerase FkpA
MPGCAGFGGTLDAMIAVLRPARLALVLILAATVTGCDFGKTSSASPTAPDQSNVPYSQTDLTVGTGATASAGTTATVAYGAWLYSDTTADHKGTQVDSSQFSFQLGANQVIKGFDQGVAGMKEGGTRRLIVPPSLAYGAQGYQTIPPNAALVFDIALITAVGP